MKRDDSPQENSDLALRYQTGAVLNRESEQDALEERLSQSTATNLYLSGPRGCGKSTVTKHVIEQLPDHIETSYISCLNNTTQYEVLDELLYTLTGTQLGTGYHTSDLKDRIEEHLDTAETTIVLDEIDFLLNNDGSDLLYYLSRIELDQHLNIIGISSNNPDLAAVIDNRTYSSLLPDHIDFEPYSQEQTRGILANIVRHSDLSKAINQDALDHISSTTQNIRFALHWLDLATTTADEQVTEEAVEIAHLEAVQRYQDILLKDFTTHHYILLEAINQLLSENGDTITTGVVYDRYDDLCDAVDETNLSHRQLSDYLTHLRLLNIIQVDHYRGGAQGKTREIQLTSTF